MELSNSHAIQLIIGLILGFIFFVACFFVSPKKIFAVVVIMIPFQLVSSRYGTLNMVLVYLVFLGFLIKSKIKYWPLLLGVGSIFLVYFCSILMAPKGTWLNHIIYVTTVGSNFVLFYITYNMLIEFPHPKFALRLLIVMNVIAIAYSLVLFFVGFESVSFLGVREWTLNQNIEERSRLLGAFSSPGVTAIFFASQILFLLYAAFFTEKGKSKYLCYAMILVNFVLVVASGSRGSFLALMICLPAFMFMLKSGIGAFKMTRIIIIGSMAFVVLSLFVVFQTNYNVLFERLSSTKVSEIGVPDTRQVAFELTLKKISEKVVLGHGPTIQLLLGEEERLKGNFQSSKGLSGFPHNLILFLLYTIGVMGLIAYAVFFLGLFIKLIKALNNRCSDEAIKYMPALGIVYMALLFLDQLKIEYLRFMFSDYQHYIFYLLGMVTAFTKVSFSKTDKTKKLDNL